jgi:hypothetical protein
MGNSFFVPLQGSTLGFLTTPAYACQELPDVARMILNPKLLVDHFGNPL